MSTSLVWRPISKDRSLGYQLRYYIAEQLWGHDGSLHGGWVTVDGSILPYLCGVRAGMSSKELKQEIDKLEKLIEKHGEIEIALVS
jgi:hypothetical protein